jgi:RNA polymerase sigma-70 factor (ECF subfamily)
MDPSLPDDLTFSQLLETHRGAIYRYVRGVVADSVEAEDLTQEVFLRAYRKYHSLQDQTKVAPWLYRIAANICNDRFRHPSYRNRPQSLESDVESDCGADRLDHEAAQVPSLHEVAEQNEMSACVQEHVTDLPESYRTVIHLHDVEGLTNPEIAERLGLTVATVKIRLHRARKKLGASLGEGCSFSRDERAVFVCERKPSDRA